MDAPDPLPWPTSTRRYVARASGCYGGALSHGCAAGLQGKAFGVIGSDGTVSMFDSRKLQTGPFSQALIPGPALRPIWNDMRFSSNGIYIALCNSAGDVMMKDTYQMAMVSTRRD